MTAKEARARRVVGRARRTYLPLEGLRHKPSDYEITTTGLLYYPLRGFEVQTPVWQHYLTYQRCAALRSSAWEAFEDPALTTYSSYVAARRDQEVFLDRSFERPAAKLAPALAPLRGLVSAWRFPLHGFQMTAAYVGALAPSGRIAVVAAFQAADELRRIQRLCQWLSSSGAPLGEVDAQGRELWQRHAAFQPLRRLIEELLVTYDWSRALIALNGLIKPIFDRLWFEHVASSAARSDAETLAQVLRSLGEDARWHEAWFAELLRLVLPGDADNAAAFAAITGALQPVVLGALRELLPLFGGVLGEGSQQAALAERLESELTTRLTAMSSGGAVSREAAGHGA